MSVMSIKPYFPFCRVRFKRQSVSPEGDAAWIIAEPDERFRPVCHACGSPAKGIHSTVKRVVRDLNLCAAKVWINFGYRKVYCSRCQGVRVEDLDFFDPYQRVTKRLARYIHDLCKMLTVTETAKHVGLDWKTVKNIDKAFLEKEFGATDYDNLRILAVDEIAIQKGHKYMTVVLDYETGRVVWLGKDRKADTLRAFFKGMTQEQKEALEAIAMDMWNPFIKAVREEVPHVKIVFDFFHVVHAFNLVIDKVRVAERKEAEKSELEVYKGARYLLLKNRENIRSAEARAHLQRLLDMNETLSKVMILKDCLKRIWHYNKRGWAQKRLDEWCALARTMDNPDVLKFADMLERRSDGILNHCEYPIHTSKLEGVNNKIKVIKRKAYGFHDDRYFSLKVIQAFHSH
ncbi:MAG: ISL3 family transposase [Deltaproteobacteria bacterium]|nr:ISL3 family transposase [Deltaproteobacteria bacterium]